MASRAWEEASADFRPRGPSALSAFFKWFVRLFVIAAMTLGVAYYVPLYRAHSALLAEQALLRDKNHALDRDLTSARADLAALRTARAALDAKSQEDDNAATAAKTKVDDTLASARFKLKRFLDRKLFALEARGNRLVVSFSPGLALGVEAQPVPNVAARLALCDVATALSAVQGNIQVTAYMDATPPVSADAAPASKWDVPTRRVSRVAEALEGKCQVAPGRIATVVHDAPSTTNSGLEITADFEGSSSSAPAH